MVLLTNEIHLCQYHALKRIKYSTYCGYLSQEVKMGDIMDIVGVCDRR